MSHPFLQPGHQGAPSVPIVTGADPAPAKASGAPSFGWGLALLGVGAAVGAFLGEQYGYRAGKADTLRKVTDVITRSRGM